MAKTRSLKPLSRALGLIAGAAWVSLAAAAPARAADGSVFPPNYHFPDGTLGFRIEATNPGLIDPCWLIGFGPASGGKPHTLLDLTDPTAPMFINGSTDNAFMLEWSVMDFGDGSVEPPPAPNSDGVTTFSHQLGGHTFESIFGFGPGPVEPGSWVGFNPQPDPPGRWFAVDLQFAGPNDPFMTFRVLEDGHPLSFALEVPEPATWSLLLAGFGLVGAGLRARRRALA